MDGLELGPAVRCVNKDGGRRGGGGTPLPESSCAAVGFYDPNSFAYIANINTALGHGSLRRGPLRAAGLGRQQDGTHNFQRRGSSGPSMSSSSL